MLAGCLHWPGEVAPPPGCVPARVQRPRGSQAGGMLARTWQGGSQGWGSEDMALRTELGSPRVDRCVVPTSESVSFKNFTRCQHRS